jgi:aspartate/methionine/tyrosine aminotransferase
VSSVLTWGGAAATDGIASNRLRDLRASHSAMWNYVTYRDAIGLVGWDPDELYPGGTTRLPTDFADLGWLVCFAGPPPAAVRAMREAVSADALNHYPPDLIEPLREEAARVVGRARDDDFEVIGVEGAQAGIALSLLAAIDPGDEVILGDPGYFHLPSAVIAAGGRPVMVSAGRRSGFRIDVEAVAEAVGPRTRAICLVDPSNPYGAVLERDELKALAALAERRGLLLVHDVTHAPLVIDPAGEHASLPALGLTDRAVATFSVSHCWGMASARIGFLAGPRDLLRGCLQLKAAVTRMSTGFASQQGALAALRDREHLPRAERAIRRNLGALDEALAAMPGVGLATRPSRGLSCAVEIDPALCTAQELMVALFARRIAVYPGDGLGETSAAATIRLNLSHPERWPMERLRDALPAAAAEAAAGRWREPVAELLDAKGTERAQRLAAVVRRSA